MFYIVGRRTTTPTRRCIGRNKPKLFRDLLAIFSLTKDRFQQNIGPGFLLMFNSIDIRNIYKNTNDDNWGINNLQTLISNITAGEHHLTFNSNNILSQCKLTFQAKN